LVFNLGVGEVTVLALLALIFFGPSKLPDLAERLREARWRGGGALRGHPQKPWSLSEWLLFGAVLALGAIAVARAVT